MVLVRKGKCGQYFVKNYDLYDTTAKYTVGTINIIINVIRYDSYYEYEYDYEVKF